VRADAKPPGRFRIPKKKSSDSESSVTETSTDIATDATADVIKSTIVKEEPGSDYEPELQIAEMPETEASTGSVDQVETEVAPHPQVPRVEEEVRVKVEVDGEVFCGFFVANLFRINCPMIRNSKSDSCGEQRVGQMQLMVRYIMTTFLCTVRLGVSNHGAVDSEKDFQQIFFL
jgi:hypothetical protein